ncbi:MAG: phage minor head protein [Pseudomonadota bacterium]
MADPELRASFRRPFAEQLAAFRIRLQQLEPTTNWDDLRGLQHDRAFMVAGARSADLLADLAEAVDKAIETGTGLEEFRRDFRQIVEQRGWHGWTGEGSKAGEAWRTRVILQTNMLTTIAAGRLAQLRAGNFKFWVYRHSGAENPRLQHLAWDGLILPADHPFWATHYPPNGWGCGCRVVGANTLAGAIRVGGKPQVKLPSNWASLDPRTGAPLGIGKGWDHAPGASVSELIAALKPKLELLPRQPAVDLIQDWLLSGAFRSWFQAPVGNWPVARIAQTDARRLGAQTRVTYLSPETLAKQLRHHPEISFDDYRQVQAVIDEATDVVQDGARNLIYVLNAPDGRVLVVKAVQSADELFVTSFRRLSSNDAKRDRELQRLLSKGG